MRLVCVCQHCMPEMIKAGRDYAENMIGTGIRCWRCGCKTASWFWFYV